MIVVFHLFCYVRINKHVCKAFPFVFSSFLVPFSHSNLPSKCLPVWDSLLQFGPRNFLLPFVIIIFRTSDSLSNSVQLFKLKCLRRRKNLINQISGRHTKRAIDPKVRLKIKKSASAWIIFVFVIVWINGLIENLDKEKTFTEKKNKIKKYYQLEEIKRHARCMYMLQQWRFRAFAECSSSQDMKILHTCIFWSSNNKIYSLN